MGSKLLIHDEPLQVLPSLAVAVGLNEAIILQQIHYWLQKSERRMEGKTWIYNTYTQWQRQFPFWSYNTIRRAMDQLKALGIIEATTRFNRSPIDKTWWYTINYERLNDFDVPRDVPPTAQDGLSTAQDGLSTAQDGLSTAQDGLTPRDYIQRDPTEIEENLSPAEISYPGEMNGVHLPGLTDVPSPVAAPTKEAKTKKAKTVPISDEDWPGLRTMLTSFHLPLAQLDDNEWWNDLSYTCNSPSNEWLERQFAKMHAWLKENPHKQPTTRWKTFMRGWLERAYEYERKTNGTKKTYTRK